MAAARRTWRWRTVADPWAPTLEQCRRLEIPVAPRVPHPDLRFDDGHEVVAPWRAALRPRP